MYKGYVITICNHTEKGARMKFSHKLSYILSNRGETLYDLQDATGVNRTTVYKGIRSRPTLCAIAYHLGMTVEELVENTEMVDVWYN